MKYKIYTGSNKRKSVYTVLESSSKLKDVIIFVHGFKGFLDWGPWKLLMQNISDQGHICYLFNFSHNGGTIDNPIDFPDLEAFGNNRFTYELHDLDKLISIANKDHPEKKIYLLGHSRGGGIALLAGANNPKVSSIITLASVSDLMFNLKDDKQINLWKETGCIYIDNARTKQQMPLNYSLYTDYELNKERLNIKKVISNSDKPMLHIHGMADSTVSFESAVMLSKWSGGKLELIKSANHTFGACLLYTSPSPRDPE